MINKKDWDEIDLPVVKAALEFLYQHENISLYSLDVISDFIVQVEHLKEKTLRNIPKIERK